MIELHTSWILKEYHVLITNKIDNLWNWFNWWTCIGSSNKSCWHCNTKVTGVFFGAVSVLSFITLTFLLWLFSYSTICLLGSFWNIWFGWSFVCLCWCITRYNRRNCLVILCLLPVLVTVFNQYRSFFICHQFIIKNHIFDQNIEGTEWNGKVSRMQWSFRLLILKA